MSKPPHQWLLDTDDERVFHLFLTAVNGLRIDDQGVWSLPAEIEATVRLARQVQERTEPGTPLNLLATTTRVLLWKTGIPSESLLQLDYPALVRSFYRERAALADMLEPTPIGVADIMDTAEHSQRAVLHNGRACGRTHARWIEPRFDEQANAADPFEGCADCPQRATTDGACCGSWAFP